MDIVLIFSQYKIRIDCIQSEIEILHFFTLQHNHKSNILQTLRLFFFDNILGSNPTSGPNPGGPAETKTLTISQTWSQEPNGYER